MFVIFAAYPDWNQPKGFELFVMVGIILFALVSGFIKGVKS